MPPPNSRRSAQSKPTATAAYTATSLNYTGSDTTATNTFLGLDANGTAATDATAIHTTIFDATGFVAIPSAGTYTFGVNDRNDASYVFVAGQMIADVPGVHGGQAASRTRGILGGGQLSNRSAVRQSGLQHCDWRNVPVHRPQRRARRQSSLMLSASRPRSSCWA